MTQQAEALAAYERACGHDSAGREAEAIPEYERALALGLPAETRSQALLGLGSSLRNVGRADESVRLLRAAVGEFPEDAALRCFLGLALHSAGEGRQAMVALLDVALKHAPVGRYMRALGEYRDRLEHVGTDDDILDVARSLTRLEFARAFECPFLVAIGAKEPPRDKTFLDEDTLVGKRPEPSLPGDNDDGPPHVLPLRKSSTELPTAITLGRSAKADVVIDDQLVSKIHALLRSTGSRFELSDAGSRNGTWVGHQRVEHTPVKLQPGDVLTFGRAAFYFLDAGALWDRLRKKR
jgi:tetratricopeptide (TPR) repeat protein